jgi:hypothetical protein
MGALCGADSVQCSNVIPAEKFPAAPTLNVMAALRRRAFWRTAAIAMAAAVLALLAAWFARAPLLEAAAKA